MSEGSKDDLDAEKRGGSGDLGLIQKEENEEGTRKRSS